MTTREILALEYSDFPDFPKSTAMEENCSACGCRVGDHWARLNGDAIGWVGCAVALAQKKKAS